MANDSGLRASEIKGVLLSEIENYGEALQVEEVGEVLDLAREYMSLMDQHFNRIHVEVTLARKFDGDSMEEMEKRLTTALGKTAIPHVRVKPGILGGAIVRTGDTIYDGSLRRKLEGMRRRLLKADLPRVGEV